MARAFHTLDVFAEEPLAGNPLAVVLDCNGLDPQKMQAIAREFNLSETVFVTAPRDPTHAARLRIFTPARELAFAGHPTIGAAAILAELRAADVLARGEVGVMLEEEIGVIACSVWRGGDKRLHASFELPQPPCKIGQPPSPADLATALSLVPDDIGFEGHGVSLWSAGTSFIMAPIATREAMARARPAAHLWDRLGPPGLRNVFLYCKETTRPQNHVHARVFAPDIGVAEDPATGSAVAAFAGAAVEAERPEDGEHTISIEQGEEMARPSRIALHMSIEAGALVRASVSGGVIRVMDGGLHL